MAEILWLHQGSYQSITSYVDLHSGDDGIYVREWAPAISDGRSVVDEVINLKIIGSSKNDLASKIQKLDDMVRNVQSYQEDPAQHRMVFITSKLDGESNHRRALILDARLKFTEGLGTAPTTPGNIINNLQLGITRAPLWEYGGAYLSGGESQEIYRTAVRCNGGLGDYGVTTNVIGTDPARIDSFTVTWWSPGGAGGPLTEFWYGFRTDEWGDRDLFEATWECEDAAPASFGSNVSKQSIGNASGSEVIRYAAPNDTDALADRFTIRMGDAVDYPAHQRGIFTVLLRARCTSTRTFQVRMNDGFFGSDNFRAHSRVGVTSTSWYLYPLGIVAFPPGRYHQQQVSWASFLDGYSIKLSAGVLGAGSGNLECDCLYLIPQSEGACHVNHTNVKSGSYYFTVWTDPDGTVYSTSHEGSAYIGETPIVSPTLYGLPTKRGVLVVVGQRASDHALTDHINARMRYNARWRTLRGAD